MTAQMPPAPPYHLYLLECEDGTLYTGVALNVEQRFIQHALGLGAAYTRAHPPRRVLACRPYASKGDALRAEYALKQVRRSLKLTFFSAVERLADAALPPLALARSKRSPSAPRNAGLPA